MIHADGRNLSHQDNSTPFSICTNCVRLSDAVGHGVGEECVKLAQRVASGQRLKAKQGQWIGGIVFGCYREFIANTGNVSNPRSHICPTTWLRSTKAVFSGIKHHRKLPPTVRSVRPSSRPHARTGIRIDYKAIDAAHAARRRFRERADLQVPSF